jgi:hypothetical protein
VIRFCGSNFTQRTSTPDEAINSHSREIDPKSR